MVSEPRAVATGLGYAGVPPANVQSGPLKIKQSGRLRTQGRSLPLAVLTQYRTGELDIKAHPSYHVHFDLERDGEDQTD